MLETPQQDAYNAKGCIVDPVNNNWLGPAYLRSLSEDKRGEIAEIHLCESLQEIASAKYFYEGLLSFSNTKIPLGADYGQWREERRR